MKIDTNPTVGVYTPERPAVSLSKQEKKPVDSPQEAAAAAPGDADRLKLAVRDLLAQSDIRPEVVAAKKPTDAAAVPSDEQLSYFIKALRAEP